jgi:hypothetical protein
MTHRNTFKSSPRVGFMLYRYANSTERVFLNHRRLHDNSNALTELFDVIGKRSVVGYDNRLVRQPEFGNVI